MSRLPNEMSSPLGRVVESGVTDEQAKRKTFQARKELYETEGVVAIPLDHPKVKGAFRAIIEAFAETEYRTQRKQERA